MIALVYVKLLGIKIWKNLQIQTFFSFFQFLEPKLGSLMKSGPESDDY